jgi:peptidoglycan/LPS O-acetylase OafA/YrhL
MISPNAEYGYIPALDGLRAISVLIVLVAHFGLDHIVPGGLGVTIFFFISGFLITRLLISEAETDGYIHLKNFYIRRVARLYPALLFMILISSLLFLAFGYGAPTRDELIAGIFYGMNFLLVLQSIGYGETYMSWNPLWSLAVEEHFYLFFPALLVLFKLKWRLIISVVSVLIVGTMFWRIVVVFGTKLDVEIYTYVMSDTRMDSLLWGCLATLIMHVYPKLTSNKWLVGWIPTLVATLALLSTLLIRDETYRNTIRYSIQGASFLVLIFNLYFHAHLKFFVFLLEWKPLAWLGRISYPLYLWHFVMLDFWMRTLDHPVMVIVFAATTSMLAATISFYIVEKPMMFLRKRYGAHIPERA